MTRTNTNIQPRYLMHHLKRLIFLIITTSCFSFNLKAIQNSDCNSDSTYKVVEQLPKLNDSISIKKWFTDLTHTFYSEHHKCCLWKSLITFSIDKKGLIGNIDIVVNSVMCESGLIGQGKETEAIKKRIIQQLESSPRFIPAKIKGKPVCYIVQFPVHVDCSF